MPKRSGEAGSGKGHIVYRVREVLLPVATEPREEAILGDRDCELTSIS
jgi:hypothetical protein